MSISCGNVLFSGEKGYKIPQGGMFKFVSAAKYFGKIVEWFGFAIATWSYTGLAFAVCTAFNLVPRLGVKTPWYE